MFNENPFCSPKIKYFVGTNKTLGLDDNDTHMKLFSWKLMCLVCCFKKLMNYSQMRNLSLLRFIHEQE